MICAGVLVLLSPYLDESRLRLFILWLVRINLSHRPAGKSSYFRVSMYRHVSVFFATGHTTGGGG